MDYSDFVIPGCPATVIYIPNFITSEEEQHILRHVAEAPKPKWTQLARRRLLNYGGLPHANGMVAEVIPPWLQTYVQKINNLGILGGQHQANHVLVNEYLRGQGIMPHTDGPLYHPIISTISCGSHTVLRLQKASVAEGEAAAAAASAVSVGDKEQMEILVERRSLLVIKDEAYHSYLHAIAELEVDVVAPTIANISQCEHVYEKNQRLTRGTRISLTIRHVPKTSRLKIKFGK